MQRAAQVFGSMEFWPDRTGERKRRRRRRRAGMALGLRRELAGRRKRGFSKSKNLEIDSGKAVAHLGWRPEWPLATATAQAIAWYRSFYTGNDMREVTAEQIDVYAGNQGRPAPNLPTI